MSPLALYDSLSDNKLKEFSQKKKIKLDPPLSNLWYRSVDRAVEQILNLEQLKNAGDILATLNPVILPNWEWRFSYAAMSSV